MGGSSLSPRPQLALWCSLHDAFAVTLLHSLLLSPLRCCCDGLQLYFLDLAFTHFARRRDAYCLEFFVFAPRSGLALRHSSRLGLSSFRPFSRYLLAGMLFLLLPIVVCLLFCFVPFFLFFAIFIFYFLFLCIIFSLGL